MIAILVVMVVLMAVLQTPLFRLARDRAWLAWTATVGTWFRIGPLTVSNNVAEQLQKLRAQNIRLQAENMDYRRLRQQLGWRAFDDYRAVIADVAARPIDTFHSQFIVNRGVRDGIILGAPVVINESVLVGFIVQLHEATAVLQLLNHPNTSLPAEVVGSEDTARGLVKGVSFTDVELVTVPRDVVLRNGQNVVSLVQDIVPGGLLIGTIHEVQDEETEPYQRARITVPYDADRLYAVAILVGV